MEDFKFGIRTVQSTEWSPDDFEDVHKNLLFSKGSKTNDTKEVQIDLEFDDLEGEEKEDLENKGKTFHIELYDLSLERFPKLSGDDTLAKVILKNGSRNLKDSMTSTAMTNASSMAE